MESKSAFQIRACLWLRLASIRTFVFLVNIEQGLAVSTASLQGNFLVQLCNLLLSCLLFRNPFAQDHLFKSQMLKLDVVFVKQAWAVLRRIFWRLRVTIYVMRRPRIITFIWTQVDRIIFNVFALDFDWSEERLRRLRFFTKDLKRLLHISLSLLSSL